MYLYLSKISADIQIFTFGAKENIWPTKDEEREENCIMRRLMTFNPHQMLITSRMRWAGHVARMGERCILGFCGKT
jgi:hypothetical protein